MDLIKKLLNLSCRIVYSHQTRIFSFTYYILGDIDGTWILVIYLR